jgi:hypothetical protein
MKLLKRILIGILGVIALLLITAVFVKKDYRVEREVVVNKPKADVFNYVKLARNQDYFNKWVMMDPQIKKNYKGTDGTVGFVYAWDSKGKAGQGEQEITGIREGERVDMNIHFIKPIESNATVAFTTEAVAGKQTKVKWSIDGHSPYPLNLMNLFVPGLLGNDMQTSLTTLKTVLEKQ